MRGFSKEYKWSTNLVAWGHQRESQHFKAHLHHIDSSTKYPPCLLLIGWKHFFHGPFGPHQPTTTPAASLHVSLMYDFFSVFKFLYDINYSHNLISKFYTKVLHLIQRHRTLFYGFSQKWCLVSVRTSLALTTDRWWIQLRPWETKNLLMISARQFYFYASFKLRVVCNGS